jgi:hypothetical protein
MTVYVLSFSQPLGNPDKCHSAAQTYTGWCRSEHPQYRFKTHLRGAGAAIVRAAVERSLDVRIAAVIPGATRADERRIKNWHDMPALLRRWSKTGTYKQANGNILPVLFPGRSEFGL